MLEPVPFLANIVLVANADKARSGAEEDQIELVRKELKFKKGDLNTAIRSVEEGKFQLSPVGLFSDQVKNLEMMLRVAYASDDLSESELSLLIEFCRVAGIHEDQLTRMREEVLATLQLQEKVCATCGASAGVGARFCPGCGASLSEAEDAVLLDYTIPESGIAIEFAESSAAAFPRALELARATNGFQTCQKNRKTWYLAAYQSGDLLDAIPLIDSLSGVRNRRVHVDGQERMWEEVFGFAYCAAQRATAYRPVEYCFGKDEKRLNLWGCKHARMDWTGWADWLCYGQWEKVGFLGGKIQWRFDKERIRHELATNLFRVRFCPHLRTDLSEAVLRHLPDTVNPESDRRFGYHRTYEEVPGAIKVVEKERGAGMEFSNEYWADGLQPTGFHAFVDILTKALHDIGADPKAALALSDLKWNG